jgi:DNA modification methylase
MEEMKCRGYAGSIPVYCAHDKIVPVGEVKPNPKNPNHHPEEQIELLAKIIKAQGWRKPITVSTRSGLIVSGHGRLMAAKLAGVSHVPVDFQHYESEDAELADLLADNRLAELSEINDKMLAEIFSNIEMESPELTGYTQEDIEFIMGQLYLDDTEPVEAEPAPSIADRFIFPPTTVLNGRDGEWTKRKEAWKSIGIKSEVGRKESLTYTGTAVADPTFYDKKALKEKELGRSLTTKEFEDNYYIPPETDNSTSIFDPVLCELCIKWFSGTGAKVLDPFAGGSVRGIVAALSGRKYTGIDLRPEQIEANEAQWNKIKGNYPDATAPHWITGDSLKTIPTLGEKYDMIMSCPPYADLEVYSDDPADLSNMDYDDFLVAYREIIRLAVDRLEDNRFAVFVVGEVRGKDGNYISFVPDTIRAFEDAGAHFYNEAILVTPISGLRFRIGRMFSKNRKMGKTHQNVLVFIKGDPNKATELCGDVDGDMPADYTEETENE